MKKIFTFLTTFLCSTVIFAGTVVVANFDDVTPAYDAWGAIVDVIEVPAEDPSGNAWKIDVPANNSAGDGFWLACTFSKNQYNYLKFKMKSATNNFQFMLKLQSGSTATLSDKWYTYTGAGAWQEFSINLTDIEATDKIVIFPAAWKTFPAFTLYFDDLNLETLSSVSSISISGSNISTDRGTAQLTKTVLPVDAEQDVTWSVDDPTIATINAYGLLSARKNGTITITATSKESGSSINGTTQIVVSNQPIPIQSIYVDFGKNDVTNGHSTSSPDANGNYWNNALGTATIATPVALVNSANTVSGASLSITADFAGSNGILNGGLLIPTASYLADFAISSATEDYFYTSNPASLKISGLSTSKRYRFNIYSCRDATDIRISTYALAGLTSTSGTLQLSGANLGGTGINTNNSGIYASEMIQPNESGEITLTVSKSSGAYANISILKIEEFTLGGTVGFEPLSTSDIHVYPTHFNDQITIKGVKQSVQLVNSAGQLIYSQEVVSDAIINTSSFNKGFYLLVVDNNKKIKLIK